jgi:F0F1-type ATP synthase membrane subunit a
VVAVGIRLPPERSTSFATFAGPVIAMLLLSCLTRSQIAIGFKAIIGLNIPLEFLSAACAVAVMELVDERSPFVEALSVVLRLFGAIKAAEAEVQKIMTVARLWMAQVCVFEKTLIDESRLLR